VQKKPQWKRWRKWGQFVILAGYWVVFSSIAAMPEVYIQRMNLQMAGLVSDGSLVAQGVIVSRESHSGFRLWSDEGTPGHYIIRGAQSDRHILRVRLNNEEWKNEGGTQMTQYTRELKVNFDLVADGDQQVMADNYSLLLNTALLQE